jgi:hypothetical protein
MRKIQQEEMPMQTQSTIIREYANGMADGFLNDLILASERKLGPAIDSENALIDAFRKYVAESGTDKFPISLFEPRQVV